MSLVDNIQVGLDNPDCGFFVGHFTGSMYGIRLLITIGVLWYVFKAVDKLAFEPFIQWIKNKWRGKK